MVLQNEKATFLERKKATKSRTACRKRRQNPAQPVGNAFWNPLNIRDCHPSKRSPKEAFRKKRLPSTRKVEQPLLFEGIKKSKKQILPSALISDLVKASPDRWEIERERRERSEQGRGLFPDRGRLV